MKIVILDAFHDSDRGGVGILAGLLHLLKDIENEMKEDFHISVFYRFSEDDVRFKTAHRHIEKLFPSIEINGSLITTQRGGSKNVKLRRTFRRLNTILHLLLLGGRFSNNKKMQTILNADIVFSKGGHFYQSPGFKEASYFGLYQKFLSLLYAVKKDKRVYMISHSIGPFNNKKSRKFANNIFSKVKYLSIREELSKNHLKDIGFTNYENVKVLPDTAFYLKVPKEEFSTITKTYDIVRKDYVVITPRFWDFRGTKTINHKNLYGNYIESLAITTDYIITEKIASKVLLVAHNDGGHDETENDLIPVKEIFNQIKNKDKTVIIDDDLSPIQQSSIYSNSLFTIGTRLHSVIFTLIGHSPAISVGYTHKCEGIMKMCNLDDYVVDISEVTPNDLIKKVQLLTENQVKIKETLEYTIPKLRDELFNEVYSIIESK